jgi:RNA exonuclease 4
MSSMVEYPLLSSENQSPSHLQSFRGDSSSQNFGRQPHRGPPPADGLLGQGSSHHNSSSRYNSSRSPPQRYQSHIGIASNDTNNGSSSSSTVPLNKSFRKSPNRANSNVLGSSSAHNSNSKNYCNNFDPLSNSNHSTRSSNNGTGTGSFQHSYKKPMMPGKQCYLAMDCEMVGTVTGQSVAARVVLVDWKGRKVYDSYCRPIEAVSDYRTFVSGVTADHLAGAPSAEQVVQVVSEILHDKILVGHGLDNDLKALGLTHPWNMTRDTAYYQPFMRLLDTAHHPAAAVSHHHHHHQQQQPVWGPRKLKDLAKEKLQRDIQVAGVSHCPVEDAASALDLYKSHRPRWEACMSNEEKRARQQALQAAAAATAAHLYTHDFDELVVVAAPVSHSSLHSYSYHGAVPVAAAAAPAAPTASMMPYHHQHHHHHQSSFRQPTYPQRQRGTMDPLQSQSFHYPRSHTMAEYRDYNAATAGVSLSNGGTASLDHHHSHSFHGFRHYSNSSSSSPSSLYNNYDPSTLPIETVEEFGGDDESFLLSAPEQQQVLLPASLLQ